jgi:hypothetical protein
MNNPINNKNRVNKRIFLLPFISTFLGLAGGFAYYHFIGCSTGSCAITSNPWLSMLWGASVGYLISDLFRDKLKKIPENENR